MPDIKLQHKLYNSYDFIGMILALSSLMTIVGVVCALVILKCLKNKKEIFGQRATIDFMLSISFFIATAGK